MFTSQAGRHPAKTESHRTDVLSTERQIIPEKGNRKEMVVQRDSRGTGRAENAEPQSLREMDRRERHQKNPGVAQRALFEDSDGVRENPRT